MLVAATAPVSFVLPLAAAHLPTVSALAVAVTVCMYFVLAFTVTLYVVVAWVRGFVPDTVIVEPLIAVTLPSARSKLPNAPRERAPDGRAPVGNPDGNPLGNDRGVPVPPGPRPPPKPPATWHLPPTAGLTNTVAAVNDVLGALELLDDEGGWAAASTQLPTFTADRLVDAVSLIAVLAVYVTVT